MILTLLNDTVVATEDLTLNPGNYHVYWDSGAGGQVDVTNVMTRQQKIQAFPAFNANTDNLRINNEQSGPGRTSTGKIGFTAPLQTGTAAIFTSQMYNDPFAAPIEQAGKVLGGAGSAAAKQVINPGVMFLLLIGGAALAAYIFWPKVMKAGGH